MNEEKETSSISDVKTLRHAISSYCAAHFIPCMVERPEYRIPRRAAVCWHERGAELLSVCSS